MQPAPEGGWRPPRSCFAVHSSSFISQGFRAEPPRPGPLLYLRLAVFLAFAKKERKKFLAQVKAVISFC